MTRAESLDAARLHGSQQHIQPLLVLGVGNIFRKDDGLGPHVLQLLQNQVDHRVELQAQSGEGSSLMAAWEGYPAVLLVDASCSGAAPGTLFEMQATETVIPSRFLHYSTHAFSVAEAIEMARALGELPTQITLLGIEGADFGAGCGLSDAVQQALPALLARLHHRIQAYFQTASQLPSQPSSQTLTPAPHIQDPGEITHA